MYGVATINQLSSNANPIADLAHAAFKDVADSQLSGDLLYIDIFSLVRETGIPGDYKEPLQPRQRRDDVLDDAVGKVFLLGVPAKGK